MAPRAFSYAAVLCLLAQAAQASDFTDVMPGAKAMGLGHAFAALADDPNAMFYNPAGTANTPYVQAGTSLGRMLSPVGSLSFGALTYLRPYEPINTATIGGAYYAGRQQDGGDKDVFLFHFSREWAVPKLPLSKPLKVGGNFKFVNIHQNGGTHFGLGFDGGVIVRSNFGLSSALVLSDLTSNVGAPRGAVTLGTAYTWRKWLTVTGDLRHRGGLGEFHTGLEAAFHQGLLKVRAGKGLRLDGVSQIALGVGVNFSPVVLDVAMTVPTSGIHRKGGHYQATFNYRFGAPSFAGSFVGSAAAQAEALRAELAKLRDEKKTLEENTQTASTHREIAEGELRVLEQRVREMQDEYRRLQKKRDEADYEARERARQVDFEPLPPVIKPKVKRGPSWPQKHAIKPGDTLRALARQYYGDPNLWEQIYEANRGKVDRGLPVVGAEFTIPRPTTTPNRPRDGDASASPSPREEAP